MEFNFAGLPANAADRFFCQQSGQRLGQLETQLDLHNARDLSLVDRWLELEVGLQINRATGIWTYPVETVNQSEGGFESVHQSVVVQPHWQVAGDSAGRWSVELMLDLNSRVDRLSGQTNSRNFATSI